MHVLRVIICTSSANWLLQSVLVVHVTMPVSNPSSLTTRAHQKSLKD